VLGPSSKEWTVTSTPDAEKDAKFNKQVVKDRQIPKFYGGSTAH
jgi:hypothetical protein